MANTTTPTPIIEKVTKKLKELLDWVYGLIASINKFRRSSFLSIFMLLIILVFVKGLDQAYTLLVDMVENPVSGSLFLCYVIVSVFALVISHYPIYIYYAKDINDSKDENFWYIHRLWFYRIFTFSKKPDSATTSNSGKKSYEQDYNAKCLRYALGLFIFSIWIFYIFETYRPKLLYTYGELDAIKYLNYFLYAFPYILMVYALKQKQKVERNNKAYKATPGNASQDSPAYQKFYTLGVVSFYICIGISITLLILATFCISFNTTSYYILQLLTLSLSLTYLSFRLFRSKLYTYASVPLIRYIEVNLNYVLFFFYIAVFILCLIIYCNIGVAYQWPLPNAMVILFGYFYLIYYLLACVFKYLFVVQAIKRQNADYTSGKLNETVYNDFSGLNPSGIKRLLPLQKQAIFVNSGKNKTIFWVILIVVLVCFYVNDDIERYVHELETFEVAKKDSILPMNDYIADLKKMKKEGPIIFVASHGGALKANIWTMKVLNHIQKITDGKFLDQTASFSGASGGMMGLSMYSVLSGQFSNKFKGNRYDSINKRINDVAEADFASRDISYTLGWDFIRKNPILHLFSKHRDRAYYSMVAYQNLLEGILPENDDRRLTSESFQHYWWKNMYRKNDYFPAILVNTAKTNGRRGVFCSISLDTEKDKDVFINADNLSQLAPVNGKQMAISFYQAVSCTNRFPGFSPAAKIKGYGHYIDAGAIDNSGLLTSLDWYDRLKNGDNAVIEPETNVVFVEIINGKTNYIKHFVEKFKKHYEIEFIKFDEKEQSNLSAVVSAGVNLDKNPDYFSDLVERLEKRGRKEVVKSQYEECDSLQFRQDSIRNSKKFTVKYRPIYLPRVITLEDVQSFLGGTTKNIKVINSKGEVIHIQDSLEKYLTIVNNKIYKASECALNKTAWDTYEPTLARHLSKSTVNYYDRILKNSKDVEDQIKKITDELNLP
ncbi:MAG: hypothetical protein AAF617_09255 [Bacteroidota bacterium]